jgi:hypothetical protein
MSWSPLIADNSQSGYCVSCLFVLGGLGDPVLTRRNMGTNSSCQKASACGDANRLHLQIAAAAYNRCGTFKAALYACTPVYKVAQHKSLEGDRRHQS